MCFVSCETVSAGSLVYVICYLASLVVLCFLCLHTCFLIASLPLDGDVLAIKEHLIDELDYILVPTEGWNKLVSWYGLTEVQEPIARKVRVQS